jgi:protein gp37
MPYEGLAEIGPKGPRWTGKVRLVPEHLADPLRWRKPQRIFVNSMSDLFHESLPFEQIAAVFGVMAACPQHTFQILTKRAARLPEFFAWFADGFNDKWDAARRPAYALLMKAGKIGQAERLGVVQAHPRWPLPNVWLGVSVEDQKTADERIPHLLATPAAVRFISAEPLLGPIDLDPPLCEYHGGEHVVEGGEAQPWCVECDTEASFGHWIGNEGGLDWVIVGGESGPGARPMHSEWARSVRDQCAAAGVAFHFKQWGAWAPVLAPRKPWVYVSAAGAVAGPNQPRSEETKDCEMVRPVGKKAAGRLLDGRTHDEFPAPVAEGR